MNSGFRFLGVFAWGCALALLLALSSGAQEPEEFNGPFASYLSVKDAPYLAVGDGIADDTAAIQRAINAVGMDEDKVVLYFPSGTYRITRTLEFPGTNSVRLANKLIIGEDPMTTRFKWVGSPGGDVMWMRSVHSTRWGRFAVDGAGVARSAIRIERDAPRGAEVSSYLQFHDLVLENARNGILNSDDLLPHNDMDAEVSILRCRFRNHSEAGFHTIPGNGFDYWIRGCLFEDCRVGASSFNGDFRVWHSVFRNSGEFDVVVKGHRNAGIHGNYSEGSRRFAHVQSSNGLLQDNVIIDPIETDAVQISTEYWRQGSLVLLDNRFRSRPSATRGPVIHEMLRQAGAERLMPGLAILGNQFTVTNPLGLTPNPTLAWDNVTVTRASIPALPPALPRTPPRVSRRVFTVNDAGDFQAQINQAATHAREHPGSRPVVHLPSGPGKAVAYRTSQTITIPAHAEFSIVGDGFMSRLGWKGQEGGGPVLRLEGPSRVTLRDLFFFDDSTPLADIVVENVDQPDAIAYFDNCAIGGGGLLADGLVNTRVDLVDSLPHRIQVLGGTMDGPSRVGWFAGAGSGDAAYEVKDGGKLLVQDVWFEDGGRSVVFKASGSSAHDGRLMVTSSFFFNNAGPTEPLTRVSDFRGFVSWIGANLTSGAAIDSGGALSYLDLLADHPVISGSPARSFSWTFNQMPEVPHALIDEHLAFLRATRPDRVHAPRGPGVTDVRFHRLNIYVGGRRGVVLKRG